MKCPASHPYFGLTTILFRSFSCVAARNHQPFASWQPLDQSVSPAACRALPLPPVDVSAEICDGDVLVSWTPAVQPTATLPVIMFAVYLHVNAPDALLLGNVSVSASTLGSGATSALTAALPTLPASAATSGVPPTVSVVALSLNGARADGAPAATLPPVSQWHNPAYGCGFLLVQPGSTLASEAAGAPGAAAPAVAVAALSTNTSSLPITPAALLAFGHDAVQVLVSPAAAPARVTLSLAVPPGPLETLELICVSEDPSLGTVSPASQSLTAATWDAGFLLFVTGRAPAEGTNALVVRPYTVQCVTRSSAEPGAQQVYRSSTTSFPVHVVNTVVPTLFDFVVQSPSGKSLSSRTAAGVFSAVVSGSLNATLTANPALGPRFFPGVQVVVGGLPATVLTLSDDWTNVTVQLPSYADVCGAGACGAGLGAFVPLEVHNPMRLTEPLPPSVNVPASLLEAGWQQLSLGGAIACPPDCPLPGAGVLYSLACVGFDEGPACADPTSTASCAYGAGDACSSCPGGAVCPGGFRVWPLPGHWARHESSPAVVACSQPATARCLGFNATLGVSACGEGCACGMALGVGRWALGVGRWALGVGLFTCASLLLLLPALASRFP